MEKLVKGVKPEGWKAFRSEAAKHGLRVGEFLDYLVEEHMKMERKGKSWDHIESKKRTLDADDAAKIKKSTEPFEKERDFE